MKQKFILTSLALVITAATAVQAAPKIDPARIDSMTAQALQQAEHNPDMKGQVNGSTIRQEVTRQLQTLEVLKAEAFKVGLDKDADVQNQLKNLEAQFYAAKYAEYLENNIQVDEADVRRLYNQLARTVKIQQVSFATANEANDAQKLLLKGLSFEELMKRYPNNEQNFDQFVRPQQLPPQWADVVAKMNRGDVTTEPVPFNGRFYLIKLAAERNASDMPPFEQIKDQLIQQTKQQKVQEQINQLLKANGIEAPAHPQP